MSVFADEVITCPHCDHAAVMSVAQSVNAQRSPHYRQAILEAEFQRPNCERCGEAFEISTPFLYVDLGRGQWYGVFGEEEEPSWRHLERQPHEAFMVSAGPGAPVAAQEVVRDASVRAVFGLNALREKLLCHDAGLSDLWLEVLKFSVGLAPDGELLDETNHLRLIGFDPKGDLLFLLGGVYTDQAPSLKMISRDRYLDIIADTDKWTSVAESLTKGPYVDIGRFMIKGDAAQL